MSMPNIPNMNPTITINRDDAVNMILSSIGMEELSLAHIVNAEAEKIQFALGTLETADGAATLEDIMAVNASAKRMLRDVIKNQMLIGMKMEDTVDFAYAQCTTKPEVKPEPEPEPQPQSKAKDEVKSDTTTEPDPQSDPQPDDSQRTSAPVDDDPNSQADPQADPQPDAQA